MAVSHSSHTLVTWHSLGKYHLRLQGLFLVTSPHCSWLKHWCLWESLSSHCTWQTSPKEDHLCFLLWIVLWWLQSFAFAMSRIPKFSSSQGLVATYLSQCFWDQEPLNIHMCGGVLVRDNATTRSTSLLDFEANRCWLKKWVRKEPSGTLWGCLDEHFSTIPWGCLWVIPMFFFSSFHLVDSLTW